MGSSFVIVPGSEDDVPGQTSINPRGKEAQERAKFEQLDTVYTRTKGITGHFPPGNPYVFREFPKMLYQARENVHRNNKLMCMTEEPRRYEFPTEEQWLNARDAAVAFNTSCQREVKDEAEQQAAFESGYRESIKAAMEAGNARQLGVTVDAAHRAHDDRNMSPKAKAESAAAEEASPGVNLREIKVQPLARKLRGFAALTPAQRKASLTKAAATRAANRAAKAAQSAG